jgi:NADH dehydrogenase, FAD-containing subunit
MTNEVVVAGGGFSGLGAALKLDRKGHDVTLVDEDGSHEFIPGIIDRIRGRKDEDVNILELDEFLEDTAVDLREESVTRFVPEEDVVETSKGRINYDDLVVALGGVTFEPFELGDGVEKFYKEEDAERVVSRLDSGDSVVIVGGGYVGIELAGELAESDHDVTVVDAATRPMSNSRDEVSRKVVDYMNDSGIAFRGDKRVEEAHEDMVIFEDGTSEEGDLVVWAGGISANPVVQECFDCGRQGMPVNNGLASTDHDNVYGLGDCADTGQIKTAHNAMTQAGVVAENVDRSGSEELEQLSEEKKIIDLSLGDTGLFIFGDRSYKNPVFRYLKDVVRFQYFVRIRVERLAAKYL